MTQITIQNITGGTYPIDVYISDIYLNNQTFIGTITSGPVPPDVNYNSTIPEIFNTAPEIMLILVDDNNCQVFKSLTCGIIGNILIYQNNIEFRLQNGDLLIIQI